MLLKSFFIAIKTAETKSHWYHVNSFWSLIDKGGTQLLKLSTKGMIVQQNKWLLKIPD
jgi:hypothetical protein